MSNNFEAAPRDNSSNYVVDPAKIELFCGALKQFKDALKRADQEVNILLSDPGINSDEITEQIRKLKAGLENLSSNWDQVSIKFSKNLNASLDDYNRFLAAMKKELGL